MVLRRLRVPTRPRLAPENPQRPRDEARVEEHDSAAEPGQRELPVAYVADGERLFEAGRELAVPREERLEEHDLKGGHADRREMRPARRRVARGRQRSYRGVAKRELDRLAAEPDAGERAKTARGAARRVVAFAEKHEQRPEARPDERRDAGRGKRDAGQLRGGVRTWNRRIKPEVASSPRVVCQRVVARARRGDAAAAYESGTTVDVVRAARARRRRGSEGTATPRQRGRGDAPGRIAATRRRRRGLIAVSAQARGRAPDSAR